MSGAVERCEIRMAVFCEGELGSVWVSVTVGDVGKEVELEGEWVGMGLGGNGGIGWLDGSRVSSSLFSFPSGVSCLGMRPQCGLVVCSSGRVLSYDGRGALVP